MDRERVMLLLLTLKRTIAQLLVGVGKVMVEGKAGEKVTRAETEIALMSAISLSTFPYLSLSLSSPSSSLKSASQTMSQIAARFAVPLGLGFIALQSSLYDVPGGE